MMKKTFGAVEKRAVARRIVIYGAVAFVLGVLQCSFFSRLKLFGATPDLILGSLCAIVVLDDKKASFVYAVASGYFIDAIGSVTPSFSPVFYLLCAAFATIIAEKLIPRFLSYAIMLLPLVIFKGLFTYLNLWIAAGALPSPSASLGIVLPEMLCTFIFCLPIYYLIKLCTVPMSAKNNFGF
jgi:hypothetical protein